MNNAFFSPAFRRFRTIAYLSLTKTINPFIPETSLPARDKTQSNSKIKEKKRIIDVVSSSQFLELIDSSSIFSLCLTRVNRVNF